MVCKQFPNFLNYVENTILKPFKEKIVKT